MVNVHRSQRICQQLYRSHVVLEAVKAPLLLLHPQPQSRLRPSRPLTRKTPTTATTTTSTRTTAATFFAAAAAGAGGVAVAVGVSRVRTTGGVVGAACCLLLKLRLQLLTSI
jgi:hypothetical protein